MKMIDWAIVLVLILFPFSIVNRTESEMLRMSQLTELRYNAALDAAVDDAAQALTMNVEQGKEVQYDSAKKLPVNKEAAMEAFHRTLYMNFGILDDPVAQGVFNRYIPAVTIIGYDGFYVYAEEEFTNAAGETEVRPVWGPKKSYAYADVQGNSLAFTLDDYVTVYDASNGTWHEGFRSEIEKATTLPLLHDPANFEQVRRATIVNAIQNELAHRINRHNVYATRAGFSYTFTLPTIPEEEWTNTLDDIGVMAFIQGIPLGDKFYNNYALGGSRVMKRPVFVGVLKNNIRYYYRSTCPFSYPVQETFNSEKAAAQKGYIPLSCSNAK